MEIARMLMAKRSEIADDQKPEADDRWFDAAKQLKKGAIRGYSMEMGEGVIRLDIVPEPARRNVNHLVPGPADNTRAGDEKLEMEWARIFEVGGVPEDMWQELVDCVMDWTDNEMPPRTRAKGAETEDYYSKLPSPYKARNGLMDTVDELLLVKGFSRAILYGGVLQTNAIDGGTVSISGIADLFTTYGTANGAVNVNAASERVLRTLPGVDDVVARAIIDEREGWVDEQGKREGKPFASVEDLLGRVPDLIPEVRPYVSTDVSTICRVTSVGEVQGVKRSISCVAEFAGTGKRLAMKVRRWAEEQD
jgi:general secretion pathway protein K